MQSPTQLPVGRTVLVVVVELVVDVVLVEVVLDVVDVGELVDVVLVVLVVDVVDVVVVDVVVTARHWKFSHSKPGPQSPQDCGSPQLSGPSPHWRPASAQLCGRQHTPNLSWG